MAAGGWPGDRSFCNLLTASVSIHCLYTTRYTRWQTPCRRCLSAGRRTALQMYCRAAAYVLVLSRHSRRERNHDRDHRHGPPGPRGGRSRAEEHPVGRRAAPGGAPPARARAPPQGDSGEPGGPRPPARGRSGARLPARHARDPGGRVAGGAGARRPPGTEGGDHRAVRPEDDDQRPELRGERLHGRPRGRPVPDLGERGPGPGQPLRRGAARAGVRGPVERQVVSAGRALGDASRAPPGLAPPRKARHPGR
jgi:hypothetical protein